MEVIGFCGLLMQFDGTCLTHHMVLAFITLITCGEVTYYVYTHYLVCTSPVINPTFLLFFS